MTSKRAAKMVKEKKTKTIEIIVTCCVETNLVGKNKYFKIIFYLFKNLS